MFFARLGRGAIVAALILAIPALHATAQTKPAPAVGVTPAKTADDATIVTIFGKKHVPLRARISTSSASSCGFMTGYGNSFDDTAQNYLQSYADTAASDEAETAQDDQTSGNTGQGDVRTFAPGGDASRDSRYQMGPTGSVLNPRSLGGSMTPGSPYDRMSGCTAADAYFAAGRAYIAAHDTSLKDAYAAFDAKDYPKALDLFAKSHNKMGYDEAATMEAKMYLYGVGTEQNTAKAIYWFRKVTDTRFPIREYMNFRPSDPTHSTPRIDAAMTIARIYMVGYGIPIDTRQAKTWFGKADSYGFIPATHLLARAYVYGYGGEKDTAKALKYFRKAANVGYAPSQYEVGFAYYTGAYGLTEDRNTGAKWLLESAKGGNKDALYSVGRMYDLGETVPHDAEKALVYYKEAAVKGQPEAQDALGIYFYTGEIVGKDLVMARKWFNEAAQGGDEDAMFNLGAMYARGEGGGKDLAVAYVWFKLAEASGLEKATAAANEIATQLTPEERARAESVLHPAK